MESARSAYPIVIAIFFRLFDINNSSNGELKKNWGALKAPPSIYSLQEKSQTPDSDRFFAEFLQKNKFLTS
jgi:hypothetical protein